MTFCYVLLPKIPEILKGILRQSLYICLYLTKSRMFPLCLVAEDKYCQILFTNTESIGMWILTAHRQRKLHRRTWQEKRKACELAVSAGLTGDGELEKLPDTLLDRLLQTGCSRAVLRTRRAHASPRRRGGFTWRTESKTLKHPIINRVDYQNNIRVS